MGFHTGEDMAEKLEEEVIASVNSGDFIKNYETVFADKAAEQGISPFLLDNLDSMDEMSDDDFVIAISIVSPTLLPTPAPQPDKPTNEDEDDEMSDEETAGVGIGGFAGLLLVMFAGYSYMKARRKETKSEVKHHSSSGDDRALHNQEEYGSHNGNDDHMHQNGFPGMTNTRVVDGDLTTPNPLYDMKDTMSDGTSASSIPFVQVDFTEHPSYEASMSPTLPQTDPQKLRKQRKRDSMLVRLNLGQRTTSTLTAIETPFANVQSSTEAPEPEVAQLHSGKGGNDDVTRKRLDWKTRLHNVNEMHSSQMQTPKDELNEINDKMTFELQNLHEDTDRRIIRKSSDKFR
jgi:hypothetical protein